MIKTNWLNILICTVLLAVISLVFIQSDVILRHRNVAQERLHGLQRSLYQLDVVVESGVDTGLWDDKKIRELREKALNDINYLVASARHANALPLLFPGALNGNRSAYLVNIQRLDSEAHALLNIGTLIFTKPYEHDAPSTQHLLLQEMQKNGLLHHVSELSKAFVELDNFLWQESATYTKVLYAAFFLFIGYIILFLIKLRYDGIELEKQVQERTDDLVAQNVVLLEAQESAMQAVRLKSEFLATMSHEIRTPMNGIIGMVQMLKDTSMTQKQEQYVHTLVHSSEALLELINDILDFSKIESGKMELEVSELDLDDLAEEVVEMLSGRAREKELEVFLRYVPDTPRIVFGDSVRIRQLLTNLVGNAIKFTDAGYVKVTIGQEQDAAFVIPEGHVCLHITVEDTGIGIPQDKQDYIFDKFSQADSSTTRKFGGTGLGLAICRELTAMMGGRIWVESEMGKGSIFHFTLVVESPQHGQAVQRAEETSLAIVRGRKVLVVDDVKEYALMLSEALSLQGIRAQTAYSAKEALELLHQASLHDDPYDVAIIDYMMPDVDGVELAKRVKAHGDPLIAKLPLIMLTAVVGKLYTTRFAEAGFAAYLVKPYRLKQIIKTLAEVMVARDQGKAMPIMSKTRSKEISDVGQRFDGARVLLVEDNKVNQEVALRLLDKLGCMVVVANNGVEAIRVLSQEAFDVIFMDCQMPEMDGYEATRAIRTEKLSNAPIIALTANAMRGDKEKCLEAGMDDYVAKPAHFNDLQQALARWINHEGMPVKARNSHYDSEGEDQEMVQHIPVLCLKTWAGLRAMVGSSFEMILQHYITGSANSLETIKQSFAVQDYDSTMRAAHSLKSSSAQVGTLTLSALAKEIENAARCHDKGNDSLLATLIERLEKAQVESMGAIRKAMETA